MKASIGCLALLLLFGGLWDFSNAEEDPNHIFSSDPVLLATGGTSSTENSWLTCASKECSFSQRQTRENVYTHRKKVFYIYAKERSGTDDPIRYGDEVALFYRESNEGLGQWLSCESDRQQCGLGTCPGLPHFKHWMWNTESCLDNRFIIAGSDEPKYNTMGTRYPVKVGDEIHLIRNSDKITLSDNSSPETRTNGSFVSGKKDMHMLGGAPFQVGSGKWIIQKDMIEKCGETNYDVRYNVCDRCGSQRYLRPKDESWQCCAGEKPYNPAKSLCCEGSVSDLSNVNRDAKEARCCGVVGYFPDVQKCCLGKVHFLPGQDTDADDSTVQCCGDKPYLTSHAVCCNDVLTSLASWKAKGKETFKCCGDQGFIKERSFCLSCGKMPHVLPLSEKASWSCCKNKHIYKSDESKCCDYGVEKGTQCQCVFNNSTYISGERFSDQSSPSSCRTCVCQDGKSVCDTVTSCPAILPQGCSFYPANGECCPVFECFDDQRDNNHQIFLRRKSHVSANVAIPELEEMTISFWMKTEQDSEGTLLSYALDSRRNELVIRTHPTFRWTFKGANSTEFNKKLNDGAWHFVCTQWKSSTGVWTLYIDSTSQSSASFDVGTGRKIERHGYLVLGRLQNPRTNLIEEGAFIGEIAYFNVWDSMISTTKIGNVKSDCLGLYEGDLIRWSVGTTSIGTIDTHHSASIIKADICTGSQAKPEHRAPDADESPKEHVFLWEAVGTTLESLTGENCAQSPVYRIRSTEHSFQLKVCRSSTAGSLGNLHVFVVKGSSDSPLYWPFPYSLKLSVIVKSGNSKIDREMKNTVDRRKSKAWSLNTGSCPISGAAQGDDTTTTLNPESSTWPNFITLSDARSNYDSGKLRIKVIVYTEKYGGWLYWNGHYYSHRDRNKEKSWFSAEAACVTKGASVHLASIQSQNENEFVKSRATDEQWIGVTDHNDKDKSFEWVDGSTYGPPGYTNWATDEPKQDTTTGSGDCGTMKTDGKWADTTCEYTVPSSLATAKARGYTCKTPGKSFDYQPPTLYYPKVKPKNETGIFSVDIVTRTRRKVKVTFFTCLHYTAPNMKYTTTADKVKYAANMEFGHYVDMTVPQLGSLYDETPEAENDVSGVADLDGVVDRIKILHYSDMDNVGNKAFSFEFWLRPRRMPLPNEWMALFSKSSSSSGFISLNVDSNGTLKFTVAPKGRATPLTFVTSITTGDCKITTLEFQFVAVTGTVGSSLKIVVNGDICYSTTEATSWGGVTSLPASSEGPLLFGDSNSQGSNKPQKFNGQVAYIRLFDKERTDANIKTSMGDPYTDSDAPVGSWPLRQSKEIKLIHYVISDPHQVSDLKVLEDFDVSSSCLPVVAFERERKIDMFRLTEKNDLVTKQYMLNTDNYKLQTVSEDHTNINTGSKRADRGCFTIGYDDGPNERWIAITCRKENPHEVIFSWKVFKLNRSGKIVRVLGAGRQGSIRVAGIGSLDTRPSAKIVGDHLLLTAGTTNDAKIFFLDLKLDFRSRPSVPVRRFVPLSVGPNTVQAGVSYYCYIHRQAGVGTNTETSQSFLRRVRPQGSTSSYTVQESTVNPSTLTAKSTIDSDMPDNDWFWFLFRITTLSGGNVIQSGQRIRVETPDNNANNKRQWSFVSCNGQTLQADQHGRLWNFWIFKTRTCDPENGGYTILRGDIGPDDCILLWPKTLQFGPNCFCTSILAFPDDKQIQGARRSFGSWFGPWRLMVPTQPTPVRPLPQPATSTTTISQPRNVHEGNKYALLHFGEGIKVPSQSGVWPALLRFARTSMAPVVVHNKGKTPPVKLCFRGNGGPLPLIGAFGEAKVDEKVAFDTVYREGSFAQKRMTSGLFYCVGYTPPSDVSSAGEFKNLGRIAGLEKFEYPEPPQNFIWLVPPPFKVNGVCEAVSTIFNIADDTVQTTDPNSVASLTEVIKKATGPGSFGEGLFKPLLTVHIDVKLLHKIGDKAYEEIVKKIQSSLPQPPGSDSDTVREPDKKWQGVGDVEACLYLSNMADWKEKLEKQRIEDKLHQLFTSEWMKEEMIKITRQVAPAIMKDASKKYSSYGGIAVLIANRLRGTDFLESLLIQDLKTLKLVLQSFLPVLDAIRPDLAIDARKDIVSTLMARTILGQPWDLLRAAVDKDKKKKALGMAFDTLVGKLVPKDLRIEIQDTVRLVFRALFSPLTSTQLAIVERTLNLEKSRALDVGQANADDFKTRFLDTFTPEASTAEGIATFSQHPDIRTGLRQDTDLQVWYKNQLDAEDLQIKQVLLLKKFQRDVMVRTNTGEAPLEPFKPTSTGFIKKWLVKNPKAFARVSFAFNLIGTVAATSSLIIELEDPNSDLRQGSPTAILSAVATVVGAVGSVKGVIDFAVELKNKFYPKTANAADIEEIPMQQLDREANEALFESYVGKSYRVDMEVAERVNTRLAKYFTKAAEKMTKFFLFLGVIADVVFFSISIYNLVGDFKADKKDPWKIVDDFALAISAGAGAVIGLLAIFGVETGPAGLIVFFFGLIFIISDAIRARKEAERKLREARCKAWTDWCNWGKELCREFLKDPSVDPCSTCPITKRHLLRELCMNGHLSAAHRLLLGDRLGPSKDVKSLGHDVGMVEHKTCPAWLRHFYKRRETGKGRKGKGKQWKRADL